MALVDRELMDIDPDSGDELRFLPCPFCGCKKIDILPQGGGWMMVRCSDCDANIRQVTEFRIQMYAAWNRRA